MTFGNLAVCFEQTLGFVPPISRWVYPFAVCYIKRCCAFVAFITI